MGPKRGGIAVAGGSRNGGRTGFVLRDGLWCRVSFRFRFCVRDRIGPVYLGGAVVAMCTLVRLLAMAHTGINVNYVRTGKLVWFVDQKASAIIELISRGGCRRTLMEVSPRCVG